MPEYNPTHPPQPLAGDLTRAEVGRDAAGQQPSAWPASHLVPEPYAGPAPSREFETSGLGRRFTGRALAPDPAPAASNVEPSIAPPPGHTAQP